MTKNNDDQREFWERFSEVWVDQQVALDTLMAPVLDEVFARADLKPGMSVLDVGCGTGTSTLRAAGIVGPEGQVLGVDISESMLARARQASVGHANVSYATADAAEYAFAPGQFDALISRFGVMFFNEPVPAFENMLKSLKPGGTLTMACWSHLAENPWFQTPMYAAKERLGAPPPVDPDAPGPLAFRDIDRVTNILQSAGFENVAGIAIDLKLTPPGTLDEVARHASSIGPAARTMEHFEGTAADLDAISKSVAEAFQPHVTDKGVQVPAQINYFTATAP